MGLLLQRLLAQADLLSVHPLLPAPRTADAPLLDPEALLATLPAAERPQLVYDLDVVASAVRRFPRAFGGRAAVRYAVKCNPDPRVLRTVSAAGGGFEIASHHELGLALAAGARPQDVLFSNPVKAPAQVRAAYADGVRRFAADSPEELAKLAACAPGAEVYVRVRVDDTGSLFPLSSKFGTSVREAGRLLRSAPGLGLVPCGLTFHVGSQCTDVDAWARGVRAVAPLLADLAAEGLPLRMLDLGGGFPARYDGGAPLPDLEEVGARVLHELDALPYPPAEVVVEPGRAVVAEAAVLVATVIGRAQRGDRLWVYTDAGAYNSLMEAAQTSGALPFPLRTGRDGGPRVPGTLTGPTCDSSDTLLADVLLPADLEVGDRVVLGSAGAYSASYASRFNGFALPEAVYLR